MFHLRTCAATLRPLTASQTVRTLSQARPAAARTLGQTRCYTAPVAAEPFLSGTSCSYVEEMYFAWLEDPKSVHKVGPAGQRGARREPPAVGTSRSGRAGWPTSMEAACATCPRPHETAGHDAAPPCAEEGLQVLSCDVRVTHDLPRCRAPVFRRV